ncbi:hypothetical protein E2C01_063410 [Portunus trituberculatus]|uniref:Uncharacterized protein n=1 Tax=Portunus trituberculatus TaxID=210409 RepID=A0A5B7HI28_PORTR|nr:hypothetical protein [Portunus trituberculatus]
MKWMRTAPRQLHVLGRAAGRVGAVWVCMEKTVVFRDQGFNPETLKAPARCPRTCCHSLSST